MPELEQLLMFPGMGGGTPPRRPPPPPPGVTLREARTTLFNKFEDGGSCPCCDQYVKLYKRNITGEMAYALILLHRQDLKVPGEFIHLPRFLANHRAGKSNMASLLRLWNLIERQPGERDDGSWRIGYYRITDRGRRFAKDEILVTKYVYLYNKGVMDREDADMTRTGIEEALGEKYNYTDMMNATPDGSSSP